MAWWHRVVARLKGEKAYRSVPTRVQLLRVDVDRHQPRHVQVLDDTCSTGSRPTIQGR